ncbi:MAG: putative peptidoglycan binding domain protein [Deltaproteobacteria bacterium ADurb.Bin510]|nr:MAG: putative peptidoglycan binding domain protein [Deltaproteobacteria bacterium ADurb.Bin510]
MLAYFKQPFIAGLNGGYAVVTRVEDGAVQVLGLDQRSYRLDFKAFKQRYAWSVVLTYPGNRPGAYRLNSSGPAVRTIQERLRSLGYVAFEPDGYYGIDTARAIERLQDVYGLRRDGVAGGETLALLDLLEAL